jgi:TolA-binding protein
MKLRLLYVGLAMMSVATVIIAARTREPVTSQQTTPTMKNGGASTNQKDSASKTVQDLTDQIKDLKSRIRLLEAQQDEFRGRIARLERPQSSLDLNDAASDLARFDCESDFDRAQAMAISQGVPGYTLEGAAAMNCTQRLAKITEKAVRSVASR